MANRGWLVGVLLFACQGHAPTADDWVDVDLQGTDQLWTMLPDRCYAVAPNRVELEQSSYAGALLVVLDEPGVGVRVGVTIPDEPVSLWVGEGDGCGRFDVSLTAADDALAVKLDLECELSWVGVWALAEFTCA